MNVASVKWRQKRHKYSKESRNPICLTWFLLLFFNSSISGGKHLTAFSILRTNSFLQVSKSIYPICRSWMSVHQSFAQWRHIRRLSDDGATHIKVSHKFWNSFFSSASGLLNWAIWDVFSQVQFQWFRLLVKMFLSVGRNCTTVLPSKKLWWNNVCTFLKNSVCSGISR